MNEIPHSQDMLTKLINTPDSTFVQVYIILCCEILSIPCSLIKIIISILLSLWLHGTTTFVSS